MRDVAIEVAIEVAEAWAQNRLREGDKRIMCGELEVAIEVAIEVAEACAQNRLRASEGDKRIRARAAG